MLTPTPYISTAQVEITTVKSFRELGYEYTFGPEIAPDQPGAERADYGPVVLEGRRRHTLLPKVLSGEIDVSAPDGLDDLPAQE